MASPKFPINYDDEGALKHFTDVKNSAIIDTSLPPPEQNKNYMDPSENFWRSYESGKYYTNYKNGVISGTYTKGIVSFSMFFEMFLNAYKVQLESIASKHDISNMGTEPIFKMFRTLEEMLTDKTDDLFKKDIDGLEFLSYVHGMINHYIEKNIKE